MPAAAGDIDPFARAGIDSAEDLGLEDRHLDLGLFGNVVRLILLPGESTPSPPVFLLGRQANDPVSV